MATALADTRPELDTGHPCFGCTVRGISLCGILDNEDLRAYKQTGATIRYAAGSAIFFEGNPADSVYTVTSGALRLSKLLPDGRRQIAGFIFPGNFLGITMECTHAFTAEAITTAVLCRFSRARFEAYIESHPQMERRLYAIVAHELAAARQQLVLLGRKTAAERVVSFLLMLGDRCRNDKGLADEVDLPMSRADIADYLGLRTETVSRELSALKAAGLIQATGSHAVRLVEKRRLRDLAEG